MLRLYQLGKSPSCFLGGFCSTLLPVGLLVLVFLAVLATSPNQEPDNKARAPNHEYAVISSSRSGTQEFISVSVMVRARDGTPVQGLTADDFIVKEQGQSYRVEVTQPLLASHSSRGSPAAIHSSPI